jgi:predicted lipoprotein with Yx(FWY)xxD motif
MRIRGWAVAGLGLLVPLLAACGPSSTTPGSAYGGSPATPITSASSGSASGMGTSGTTSTGMTKTVTLTIKTTKIGKVLADAKGDTLYWYAKDMKGGPSTCTGGCLSAWPVVAGKPEAAMGVTFAGKLGSVTDAGGTVQATYNGYPLYTYSGDMTPGETAGNGEGGVWHVITGQYLASSMSGSGSTGSGSSGSGYGSGYGSGSKVSGSSSSGSSAGSGSAGKDSTSTGGSGSTGSSGSTVSTGSAGSSGSKSSNPAPAPAPTSSINGGGCGSGSCW